MIVNYRYLACALVKEPIVDRVREGEGVEGGTINDLVALT